MTQQVECQSQSIVVLLNNLFITLHLKNYSCGNFSQALVQMLLVCYNFARLLFKLYFERICFLKYTFQYTVDFLGSPLESSSQ